MTIQLIVNSAQFYKASKMLSNSKGIYVSSVSWNRVTEAHGQCPDLRPHFHPSAYNYQRFPTFYITFSQQSLTFSTIVRHRLNTKTFIDVTIVSESFANNGAAEMIHTKFQPYTRYGCFLCRCDYYSISLLGQIFGNIQME